MTVRSSEESDEYFEARFRSHFLEAERALGVPEGFVTHLLQADDWTYVLRVHALTELALFRLLASRLPEEAADWVERHNIGGRTGKLALARALDLLSKSEGVLVEKLSALRNSYTHDLRMVGVTLQEHFRSRGAGDVGTWLQLARDHMKLVGEPAAVGKITHEMIFWASPKVLLFMTAWPLIDRSLVLYEPHTTPHTLTEQMEKGPPLGSP